MIYRRLRSMVTYALLLGSLSACVGQQLAGAGAGVSAQVEATLSGVAPDRGNCGGTHGVSVSPCPLVLPKSRAFAQFSVNGPGVVSAYLKDYQDVGYCYNRKGGEICYLQNLGSPPNYWQAESGPYCGRAKPLKFYAYGVSGYIGYGFLTVVNRDCP